MIKEGQKTAFAYEHYGSAVVKRDSLGMMFNAARILSQPKQTKKADCRAKLCKHSCCGLLLQWVEKDGGGGLIKSTENPKYLKIHQHAAPPPPQQGSFDGTVLCCALFVCLLVFRSSAYTFRGVNKPPSPRQGWLTSHKRRCFCKNKQINK